MALALVGGDAPFLAELARVFLEDAAQRLSAMRDAIARKDPTALVHAAHSLKGAAGSLGAVAVSRAALRMEELAREGALDRAPVACTAVEEALEQLRPALAELASGAGAARVVGRQALPQPGDAHACVLIIDDDPTVRLATRQALRVAGFDVLTAEGGEEGLRIARDAHPDLILLDVVLSGESGLDVCQRIKADPTVADIPLLMASAQRTSSGNRADGLDAGADGYIVRPVENHELVAWVRAMLRLKAAEETNRYLRAIVESSHDAIIGARLDGTVSSWNSGAARIYGYAAPDVMDGPLAVLAHPDRPTELGVLVQRAALGDHVDDFETVQRRRDGTAIDVSLTLSPIYDASRRIIGVSVIARDISERKRAEAEQVRLRGQLRQAQRLEAIGRLTGGVAHDFNNRLTVMKGYLQFLLRRLPAEDPRRGDAERVDTTIDACARLVSQLLVFSRREPLDTRTVDLNELTGDVVPQLRKLLGERIRLRLRAAPALHRIRADPNQLEQVLLNLAANARDAMLPASGGAVGDTLTVETANVDADAFARQVLGAAVEPGCYVMLAVSDNGMGMPPEVRERIFEPFFTTKEVGQGAGLGLATVFGIVTQHRGYIACDSTPGNGTTFRLYFPCDRGTPTPGWSPAATAALRPAAQQMTVLVVEDEDNLRELLVQGLTDAGYDVVAADSSDDALRAVGQRSAPIDVLVADVAMPGESGPTLARRLMHLYPSLNVVFISGYTPDVLDLSELPSARFLQKPFDVEQLTQVIADVVSQ